MPLGNVPKSIQFNTNYTLSVMQVHTHGCWGVYGNCHRNVKGIYRIFGVPTVVNTVPNSLPEHFRIYQQEYCQSRSPLDLESTTEIVTLVNRFVSDRIDLLTTYAADQPAFPISTCKFAPALNLTLNKTHFQVEFEDDTKVILKLDEVDDQIYGQNSRVCEHYLVLRNAVVTFIDYANTLQPRPKSEKKQEWVNVAKVKLEPMKDGGMLVRVRNASLTVIPWQDSFKVPVISPLHNRGPYSPDHHDRIFRTSQHTIAKTLLTIHYRPEPRAAVPLTAQQVLERQKVEQEEKQRVETFFNSSELVRKHLQLSTGTELSWQKHLHERAQLKALPSKACKEQRDAHGHEDETSKRYLANDICHLLINRYYHVLQHEYKVFDGNVYHTLKNVLFVDSHQVIPKFRSNRFNKFAQAALATYRESLEQHSLPIWEEGTLNCTSEEYQGYKELAIPQPAQPSATAYDPDWDPEERAAYDVLSGRTTFQKFAVQDAKDEETWYLGNTKCVTGQIAPPEEIVMVAQIDLPSLGTNQILKNL